MKPLVSVIIPVYNIPEYVLKCLESIARQSYENLEIIVVDDGSTDESGKICDEFSKQDKRVTVFHQKNGGLSSARNFGILKAKGEFIALIDGDDFVKKDFIQAMVNVMKDDVDVAICGYDEFVPEGETLSGGETAARLLIKQENMEIVAWNKLYRRELFSEIKYPVGKNHEDSLTTYKILAAARKVVYVPKSLYCYIKRAGSIMDEAGVVARLKARLQAAEEAEEYFKNDAELRSAAEIAVLTAHYAFMDAAAKGKIEKKYFVSNSEWIKKHKFKFKKHKFMNLKLKFYNFLNSVKLYKLFRTIV